MCTLFFPLRDHFCPNYQPMTQHSELCPLVIKVEKANKSSKYITFGSESVQNVVSSWNNLQVSCIQIMFLKCPAKPSAASEEFVNQSNLSFGGQTKKTAAWCSFVCVLFVLLVTIVTAPSAAYEKAPRSIQPHVIWAAPCCWLFFMKTPLRTILSRVLGVR